MSGLNSISASLAEGDPLMFWVGLLVAAAVGVWLARRGLKDFWRLRLITDTPTARIRSAPQGYVEVRGLAKPRRGVLNARLTGRPCVWYRWRVEQYKRSGRSGSWVTIDGGDADVPFLVEDGTGSAEVQPEGAYLHLRLREQWQGPRPDAPNANRGHSILAFVERQRRYRMTEQRVAEGEPVYVLGRFETPRRGVRERDALTRTLLSNWKRDPERMRAFDRDGDGEIDLSEWEHARQRAARLAERSEARVSAEPPLPRLAAGGDAAQPFVVATGDDQALMNRLRLSAYGGTLLGVLLGLFAVSLLLEQFRG